MATLKFSPPLMVDDVKDDCLLVNEAFAVNHLANKVLCLEDGLEMMDYFLRRGRYCEQNKSPRPALILLDLHMPRMDGRKALKEIKSHPELRSIPVVVLTTSKEDEDIISSYTGGVSSFNPRPVTFEDLVQVAKAMGKYWFETVCIP